MISRKGLLHVRKWCRTAEVNMPREASAGLNSLKIFTFSDIHDKNIYPQQFLYFLSDQEERNRFINPKYANI